MVCMLEGGEPAVAWCSTSTDHAPFRLVLPFLRAPLLSFAGRNRHRSSAPPWYKRLFVGPLLRHPGRPRYVSSLVSCVRDRCSRPACRAAAPYPGLTLPDVKGRLEGAAGPHPRGRLPAAVVMLADRPTKLGLFGPWANSYLLPPRREDPHDEATLAPCESTPRSLGETLDHRRIPRRAAEGFSPPKECFALRLAPVGPGLFRAPSSLLVASACPPSP